MSLAYLFNSYPSPSQTFLRREVLGLEAAGIPVTRFVLRRQSGELVDADDRAEDGRIRVILEAGAIALAGACLSTLFERPVHFTRAFVQAIKLGSKSRRGTLRYFAYFVEACLLLRWLRAGGITRLHTHYGTNSATVALLCRILGGPPYSMTIHGPEDFDDPVGLSLGTKVAGAEFVAAISEFTRSQLYRWTDFNDWKKIHVVKLGVSPLFLNGGPSPVPDTKQLVNIGRIAEQKGQAILIQAAARLRDRGRVFKLVIVGDGPMRPALERLIDTLDLRGMIRITGYLSNQGVRDELLAARALVMPSFAEGLPVVFFEALALGRPVIATYIAGHPELIENGVNGWLVPAGAVEPLADAMEAVLAKDSAELEAMGRAGAQRVESEHNPRIQTQRMIELLTTSKVALAPSRLPTFAAEVQVP